MTRDEQLKLDDWLFDDDKPTDNKPTENTLLNYYNSTSNSSSCCSSSTTVTTSSCKTTTTISESRNESRTESRTTDTAMTDYKVTDDDDMKWFESLNESDLSALYDDFD